MRTTGPEEVLSGELVDVAAPAERLLYAAAAAAVLGGLYVSRAYSYLLFHSLVEILSIAVAFTLFILAWNARHYLKSGYLEFVGIGYGWIAIIDLVHTLAYQGMNIFAGYDANLPTQLWIAGRYLQAVTLLAALAYLGRRPDRAVVFGAYALAVPLLLFVIFSGRFPDCFRAGSGLTPFKILGEYVIIGMFLCALWSIRKERSSLAPRVQRLVALSIVFTIASELSFTQYASVYGPANLIGHYLKLVAFFILYRAILVRGIREPFGLIFRELKQTEGALLQANAHLEERVRERTEALAATARDLRERIAEKDAAEEALRKQFERTRLLNQIARAIVERQNLGSMLRVVLGRLVEEFPLAAATILLHERETDTLVVHLRDAGSARVAADLGLAEGTRLPVEESGLRFCLGGEIRYQPDTATSGVPFSRRLAELGLRSATAAPLTTAEGVFGVLVALRREAGGFSAEEVAFIGQASEHVALAMHQARLYENLQTAYDELRRTQGAALQQERLRALGQLASGIAHDINNALSPLTLYPELMLQQETGLSPEGRRHLQAILTAAGDIEHTVARMREFSRPQREEGEQRRMDLNALAREALELTRPRWSDVPQRRGRTVRAATGLQPELPPVLGSPSELREALANLIINAVDAMPEGGTLTIGTASPAPGTVRLSVSDTGTGMDEETRLRCLEPFFTTKGERGTGLGLAMVSGIAQRHGAAIEIESAPGAGTTFALTFPAAAEAGGAAEAPPLPAAYRGPRLRILCIDDEPAIRDGLRGVLEQEGHAVTVAGDGEAGLAELRRAVERGAPFELVITDLGMPLLDGLAVARAVKAETPGTPVFLLTGWEGQLAGGSDAGAVVDRILGKPPKVADLWLALTELAAARAGSPSSAGVPEGAAPAGQGTILVMDDEPESRIIAAHILGRLGYTVECVASGPEAVAAYRRQMDRGERPAAVLLDLNMPGGMGGLEVLSRLREADPAVRAFVASGAVDDPVVREYRRHGFSGVIAKPLRTKKVAAALQAAREPATAGAPTGE